MTKKEIVLIKERIKETRSDFYRVSFENEKIEIYKLADILYEYSLSLRSICHALGHSTKSVKSFQECDYCESLIGVFVNES